MPLAGGAVRQEVEDDTDDLPNAGMDTPVKVSSKRFPNLQIFIVNRIV